MKKQSFLNILKLGLFLLCFAGIPSLVTTIGYLQSKAAGLENLKKSNTKELSEIYTSLNDFADPQRFWCNLFQINLGANPWFWSEESKKSLIALSKECEELQKSYDFEYAVYNPNVGCIDRLSPGSLGGTKEEQLQAFYAIWEYYQGRNGRQLTTNKEEILGKVFGPQFYIEHVKLGTYKGEESILCWTDSTYKRPLLWINRDLKTGIIFVLLKPEKLKDITYLQTYLNKLSTDKNRGLGFSIKDENNKFWHSDLTESEMLEIEQASKEYEKSLSMEINTDSFWVYPKFIRPGIEVYAYYRKAKSEGIIPSYVWYAVFGILLLALYFISKYAWKIIVKQELSSLSLKWKIAFLFFFANGIPLLVLGYIGNVYLNQIRDDLIQNKITEGTKFLQDFDEKFELEQAKCIAQKDKILREILSDPNKNEVTEADVDKLYDGICHYVNGVYAIASQGKTLVRNSDGIFNEEDLRKATSEGKDYDEFHTKKKLAKKLDRTTKKQIDLANKIGSFVLSQLNNTPLKGTAGAEMEIFVESTLRRTAKTFLYEVLTQRGNFMNIGFGQKVNPAIIDMISLKGRRLYDYVIISILQGHSFEKDYLLKSIPQANRNELGLKVINWSLEEGTIPITEASFEIEEFGKRLTSYPIKEQLFINNKGVDYIAMGFACKYLKGYKLIGLYPIDIINEQIITKKKEFLIIGILSLILTILLGLGIIRSFLHPLSEINLGAQAIKNENFQYRLPPLGRDEFGDIGNIFNHVMVDLEELSVAGTIQEQLLPTGPIETGNFSLYGKSVAMGALGGDYFDFIEMEDQKFSVALGDVAGHGVGASLIMAMAKAGIIQLEDLWKEPQQLVSRLHELIFLSRTKKQRKIMTFQYLYADGKTGTACYSNAGGCSPMIIKGKSKSVEELKLQGAALGAFKKSKFTETQISFEEGDAIVFYTDGIVECKNTAGEMLGYESLKNLLLNCWDSNAETYYNNIYKAYLEYIGGDESTAGDDLTIIVLVYNKPQEALESLNV